MSKRTKNENLDKNHKKKSQSLNNEDKWAENILKKLANPIKNIISEVIKNEQEKNEDKKAENENDMNEEISPTKVITKTKKKRKGINKIRKNNIKAEIESEDEEKNENDEADKFAKQKKYDDFFYSDKIDESFYVPYTYIYVSNKSKNEYLFTFQYTDKNNKNLHYYRCKDRNCKATATLKFTEEKGKFSLGVKHNKKYEDHNYIAEKKFIERIERNDIEKEELETIFG